MTKPKDQSKKISRRDAIKLLGAVTGATVLANLPSKWSTPEIARGVLPAHAQTSSLGLSILSCDLTLDISSGDWVGSATVGPLPLPYNIPICLTLTFVNTHLSVGPAEPQPPRTVCSFAGQSDGMTGTALTSDFPSWGIALPDSGQTSGSVTALFEFANPSDGTDTCSDTVDWLITP